MSCLLIKGWTLPSAHMQLSSVVFHNFPLSMLSWGEFEIHQWSKLLFFFLCPPPTPAPLSSPEWCHSASDHRRSEGVSKAPDGSLSLRINRASPLTLSQSLSSTSSHFHSIILSFFPISSQMLWNWSDFPPYLSYLFRRLPNTSFSKWRSDRKLSTLKSFLPQKLQTPTSLASSVSNEPGGKVLEFGWVQKQNLKSRNVRSLTCFFLAVRKHQFISSPLTPGGLGVLPSLTCVCLQWHVFISFSFFGQIHSCYSHFWCEVYILEVMRKHPGSENLRNWSFAVVKLSN